MFCLFSVIHLDVHVDECLVGSNRQQYSTVQCFTCDSLVFPLACARVYVCLQARKVWGSVVNISRSLARLGAVSLGADSEEWSEMKEYVKVYSG